jgi:hypothetical protein
MGKNKYIQSPEKMWELFQNYISDLKTKEDEWLKIQYVGKFAERKEDSLKLPLTFEGFKRYCWDVEVGCIEQYFKNQDKLYDEYIPICSRIKNSIRENQIVGGMLNVFNPSITQRLNGLVDKKETELKGSLNIPNLPDIGNRK